MQKRKIEIVAHRGYWQDEAEKNTLVAIERALQYGFGFETDYRDYRGELVISHNIPQGNEPQVAEVFGLYKKYHSEAPLAINIKADGLQDKLLALLKRYEITNYFVFDMSVPDTLGYLDTGMNVASRRSEYENELPFYIDSRAVWLDCFQEDWISADEIKGHLDQGKKVCIVSPELHKRPYPEIWLRYAGLCSKDLMICTDYPQEAELYFNKL